MPAWVDQCCWVCLLLLLFVVFGFRSELLTCFCFCFCFLCDFHCKMFDCGLWTVECVNVVCIGCVFFFHVGIPKNLGFCGVSVMLVVMASFW